MVSVLRACALAGAIAIALPAGLAHADTAAMPAKSYGPDFSLPAPQPGQPDAVGGPSVTEYDLSLGCIVGGLTGTGLSVGVGGMNVVNLIAGGLVTASTPAAAYLALGGVVFASFCAVGQALTPATIAAYSYFVPPAGPDTRDSRSVDARYCLAAQPLTLPSTPESLPLFPRPTERM